MINRIIEFSAKNKFIVFLLVAAAGIMGWWSMRQVPLDAIPDLSDTQVIIYSRWDRSPDIVEDQVTYPIVNAMLGAPKVKAVRGFSDFGYSYVYVIFEDGTDIYWARSRTLEYLSTALPRLPAGRQDRAGTRRHRPGLDLPVRAGGHLGQAQPGGSPLVPGLVSPRLPEGRARGGRGRAHRGLHAAVPGERGPESSAGLRHPDQPRGGGGAGRQQRCRRPPDRVRRDRVHGPREGLRQVAPGPGADRPHGQRERHAHPDQGHRPGGAGPGHPAGRLRPGRDRRGGLRHRGHAPGRERHGRDPARQGQAQGDRARPPARREGRPHLRPVRADPAVHRQSEVHAPRDRRHRRPGDPPLPLAHPQRHHPDHHDPLRRPDLLHPVPDDGAHRQHHVAGRDRHRGGRPGGRRHRGGGADPQEAGGVEPERQVRGLPVGHHPGRERGRRPELLRPAGHRRLLPARPDPGGAGGPPVQTAGLHQDPGHDRGRDPGDHAGPGPAAPLHAAEPVRLPPPLAVPDRQHGPGGDHPSRGAASRQPGPDPAVRARGADGRSTGSGP